MRPFLITLALTVAGCAGILICGCTSSSLVDRWYDPAFQPGQLGKVLVIAIRKDATRRRLWEDAFATGLARHGVAATASYTLFPDAPPDTAQSDSVVRVNGFDGILIAVRRPTRTETHIIDGYSTTQQGVLYSYYWQTYRTFYHEVIHPGFIDTIKTAISRIDVLTTGKDGRLVWSATSRTPDPQSVMDVQRGIVALVLSDMARANMIRPVK